MQFAWQVLIHTPLWVFPLFGYLVWLGIKAMQPRTTTIWRSLIVPAAPTGRFVDPAQEIRAAAQRQTPDSRWDQCALAVISSDAAKLTSVSESVALFI